MLLQKGTEMEFERDGMKSCPIEFDHESEAHSQDAAETYRQLRQGCPIAWTEKHGGYWVATRYKDVVAIAQDGDTFGAFKTFDPANQVATGGITIPPGLVPRGLPVESDRPEWDSYRGFINRKFAPKAAEARRASIRQYAESMLDKVIERGEMDLVDDLASPVPAMATMDLMGLPLEDAHHFADSIHKLIYTPKASGDYPSVVNGVGWVFERCLQEFRKYREKPPQDNLLSYFAHEKMDGRWITDDELLSFSNNILAGGVDTTTALTTHTLVYLAQNPDERQRLTDDITLLPIAREEFVRYFTPMHGTARNARRDTSIHGADIKTGERIYLSWSSANRDPEIFDNPEEIDMSRYPNRHIAFGAGAHRCIGSFMARVAFEEMVKAVLERIPDYQVHVHNARSYPNIGTINGWINMPATFTPGTKSVRNPS